jgi:hypothetical protein
VLAFFPDNNTTTTPLYQTRRPKSTALDNWLCYKVDIRKQSNPYAPFRAQNLEKSDIKTQSSSERKAGKQCRIAAIRIIFTLVSPLWASATNCCRFPVHGRPCAGCVPEQIHAGISALFHRPAPSRKSATSTSMPVCKSVGTAKIGIISKFVKPE